MTHVQLNTINSLELATATTPCASESEIRDVTVYDTSTNKTLQLAVSIGFYMTLTGTVLFIAPFIIPLEITVVLAIFASPILWFTGLVLGAIGATNKRLITPGASIQAIASIIIFCLGIVVYFSLFWYAWQAYAGSIH
jgi:uncharacterized membrane protein